MNTFMLPSLLQVQNNLMHQSAEIGQNSLKLTTHRSVFDLYTQANELLEASSKRAMEMQVCWVKEWSDWAQYANSISGANTLPKLAERSGNIGMQAQAQLNKQMTQSAELLENTLISYQYWLSNAVSEVDRDDNTEIESGLVSETKPEPSEQSA